MQKLYQGKTMTDYVTIQAACKLLNLSDSTIRRALKTGEIQSALVKNKRLINHDSLMTWQQKRLENEGLILQAAKNPETEQHQTEMQPEINQQPSTSTVSQSVYHSQPEVSHESATIEQEPAAARIDEEPPSSLPVIPTQTIKISYFWGLFRYEYSGPALYYRHPEPLFVRIWDGLKSLWQKARQK
jgi:excisionase family DNA binding protein